MANQAKLRSFRASKRYKYGFEVPRDYHHAMQLDAANKNTKWADATQVEMDMMEKYSVFVDKGASSPVPPGYKKIRVHLIYNVKHDGRH